MILRFAELLQSHLEFVVTQGRLGAIGPENPVPDRQVEPEVAVGFLWIRGVMDPVKVGSHDDPSQNPVDAPWEASVAVVEQRRCIQKNFEKEDPGGRCPQNQNHHPLQSHRNSHFHGMESDARSDVEVSVRVVHTMKPPEPGHGMHPTVLEIDPEIEEQDRGRDSSPGRDVEDVQQSPLLTFREPGESKCAGRADQSGSQRSQKDKPSVSRPA